MTGAAELLQGLWEATLATSAATTLVLLLRTPLRRSCGWRVAYGLWVLVPVALAAVLLPAPVREYAPAGVAIVQAAGHPSHPVQSAAFDWTRAAPWLLAAWALGASASAAALARRQRRFIDRLGRLHRRGDGLWQAESIAGLPALVGLPPKLVVPADFDLRYGARERRLIVAHERLHARRADPAGNILAAALRCAFWFNPLLWLAYARFRRDQELACDEAVLARHPASRRAYGEAMLKAGLAGLPAPMACHWPAHPLKERIAMLGMPVPTARQWLSGAAIVSMLALAGGYTAWAAQPARAGSQQPDASTVDEDAAWQEIRRDARVLTPPKYPKAAADARISGKVVLLVDIDAAGDVSAVEVESATPPGVFEANAVEAARQWKFRPATKDGRPVASRKRVPVTFSMDGPSDGPDGAGGSADGSTRLPPPEYPQAAYQAGLSGKVLLLVDVDAAGNVTHAEIERATPAGVFDAATLEAVKQWKFQPPLENGRPVPGRVRVPVQFEPDGKPAAAGGQDT